MSQKKTLFWYVFLFYDFQPQRMQIRADTFDIATNFKYFWLSSEVFPFNIVLNRKKKYIDTSAYT